MAGEPAAKPGVIVMSWRLVDQVARLLEPDEREAVRGDLAELGVSSAWALWDISGLVARRQARPWTDWRPWIALVGLALPFGMILSIVSSSWAHRHSVYLWLYVNNWTWAYFESSGSRREFFTVTASFLTDSLTLICWAWTIGFALGSLSRRAIWMTRALFSLVLFGGALGSTPAAVLNPAHAEVFSLTFYRVVLPVILPTVLVWLPALWGMRRGIRPTALPLHQAMLWAAAVATLTLWAARSLEMSVIAGWWFPLAGSPAAIARWEWRGSWPLRLLPLAMMWPVGYLVVSAGWQRWQNRTLIG
jgi:hypothetical protein